MKKICILILCITLLNCSAFAYCENVTEEYPVVLMYHRVSDSEEKDAFTIAPVDFEEDINFLKQQGYIFLKAEELEKHKNFKAKSVAITFDDGYKSDYDTVLPILEKYNVSATFFVIGSLIGTEGYMSEEELKKLSNSIHVQIGNHSYNLHKSDTEEIKGLCFTNPHKIISDFEKNQQLLSEITGKEITACSYPYGIYGNYVNFELKKRGMTTFCSEEIIKQNSPFGRFNRAAENAAEDIIKNIQK